MYKIKDRLTTPILIIPTRTEKDEKSGALFTIESGDTERAWCVWKSFGGTQKDFGATNVGKQTSVIYYEDTATIECFYNPKITQDCIIQNLITGEKYTIISVIDDINQLHKYMVFKVRKKVS
jgi:hypothetical protein